MGNKKFELILIPVENTDYKKPERTNPLVEEKKYIAIDNACTEKVYLSQDGNSYVDKKALSKLLDCTKPEADYIYANTIGDSEKKNIGGVDVVNSSVLLGPLDKRAHEKREADSASLCKYSRDSLINIGDSDKAEKIRRQLDTFTDKKQKQLKKERGVDYDEITGEPLRKGSAFHHINKKSVFTDPVKAIDPKEGKNVNIETHQEIHKRGIIDENELEAQKNDIKDTVLKKKK